MVSEAALHVHTPQGLRVIDEAEGEVAPKFGSWVKAANHIVTAVIGAGVLALPNALGQLGWVAGPICILLFFVVALWAAHMLASLYDFGGEQHGRYADAVAHILGPRHEIAVAICQNTNIVMVNIAYTITASVSMQALANLACGLPQSHSTDASADGCFNQSWAMVLIFGGVQLVLSQYRSLEEAWLMSLLGSMASFGYSIIALGLSIWQVSQGNFLGSVGGIPASPSDKAFNVMNALGSIAFAYSFTLILLEIQDTIKEPPSAVKSMHRAVNAGLGVSFTFYLLVAVFGYLGLGDAVPSDIIVGFQSPSWAIGMANAFVLVHMVGAYQVFSQPIFVTIERRVFKLLKMKRPEDIMHGAESAMSGAMSAALSGHTGSGEMSAAMSGAVSGLTNMSSSTRRRITRPSPYREQSILRARQPTMKKPKGALIKKNLLLSVVVRCVYVLFTTIVACVLPFFGAVVGLVGALTFWPLSIYFPFRMYWAAKDIELPAWKKRLMLGVAAVMLLVSLAACVGSVKNVISSLQDVTLF